MPCTILKVCGILAALVFSAEVLSQAPTLLGNAKQCSISFASVGASPTFRANELCVGCTVRNLNLAVDNDPHTYAEVIIPAGIGNGSNLGMVELAVSASASVLFAAGSEPGLWVQRDRVVQEGVDRRSVRVERAGGLVSENVHSQVNVGNVNVLSIPSYFGVQASAEFDTLIYKADFTAGSGSIKIFEMCADK